MRIYVKCKLRVVLGGKRGKGEAGRGQSGLVTFSGFEIATTTLLDIWQKRGIFVPIMTTAVEQLRIRVPAARARKARAILNDLGTDTGSLVNMLLAQVVKQRAIPFRIADTDPETEEVRRDPAAVAAINAYREGKIDRWYTTEEVFGG